MGQDAGWSKVAVRRSGRVGLAEGQGGAGGSVSFYGLSVQREGVGSEERPRGPSVTNHLPGQRSRATLTPRANGRR
ncbi:hypothetical protein E2C01_064255 [Portunus trituberculatus]|uniref:Uncharacterized protein n=1 Tax=Portunus trituberculatus TaxID=210409 RepID=A0A5B7HCJ3_PORTR|nr:hypothetical protein [Portunus trituberculatus]